MERERLEASLHHRPSLPVDWLEEAVCHIERRQLQKAALEHRGARQGEEVGLCVQEEEEVMAQRMAAVMRPYLCFLASVSGVALPCH